MKVSLNEFKEMVRKMVLAEIASTAAAPSYYQGMQPKAAIQKATQDHNAALKQGNHGLANKIYSQLKSALDAQGYNWKQDPHVLSLDENKKK